MLFKIVLEGISNTKRQKSSIKDIYIEKEETKLCSQITRSFVKKIGKNEQQQKISCDL